MNVLEIPIAARVTGPVVDPNVHGHFAEHLGRGIYEGLWVGDESEIPNTRGLRNDVLDALRYLGVPVLRWPGGCFADEYHWRDGIGPPENRRPTLNTNWGGVVESNRFGTHEFLDLCSQIGALPYVCGNVGSGVVREMMEWVEYITAVRPSPMAELRTLNGREQPWKLPFFGVGNESWGCGGAMRPEYYADEFRRYSSFVKNYGGNAVYRIACGPNADDVRWTEVLLERAGDCMDGLSLHYYTLCDGWPPKGSATDFDRTEWTAVMKSALRMEEILAAHIAVMNRFDPGRRIGLVVDEWGTWFECEPGTLPGFLHQQNSIRDAVAAALTLHAFQRHADRVVMANVAQLVNVLQAVILTDGPRMLRTPTYWAFEMLKPHRGGSVIELDWTPPVLHLEGVELPALSVSATSAKGSLFVSLVNPGLDDTFRVRLLVPVRNAEGRLLTGARMTSHNTFEEPDRVIPSTLDLKLDRDGVTLEVPPHSVATARLAV